MPRYTWDVASDGTITVLTLDKPTSVTLWQAHNPERRNFMKNTIGNAYLATQLTEAEPGRYVVKMDLPERGYIAYFIEMAYASGLTEPFKFTTGVKILPDTVNNTWRMTRQTEQAGRD
jgi:PhoPQ-activated pathogenicity-related protein